MLVCDWLICWMFGNQIRRGKAWNYMWRVRREFLSLNAIEHWAIWNIMYFHKSLMGCNQSFRRDASSHHFVFLYLCESCTSRNIIESSISGNYWLEFGNTKRFILWNFQYCSEWWNETTSCKNALNIRISNANENVDQFLTCFVCRIQEYYFYIIHTIKRMQN